VGRTYKELSDSHFEKAELVQPVVTAAEESYTPNKLIPVIIMTDESVDGDLVVTFSSWKKTVEPFERLKK
jgi:hypothetical protein